MPFIPFTPQAVSDDQHTSINLKNMFFEQSGQQPFGSKVVARPGILDTTVDLSGTPRGAIRRDDNYYIVVGVKLYVITSGYVVTDISTASGVDITGSDRVSMTVVDAATTPELVIVNGSSTFVYDGVTLSLVTDSDDVNSNTVTSMDGRALKEKLGTDSWYGSNAGDATAYEALDFAQAVKSPGNILKVFAHRGTVYAFKNLFIESWYGSGSTGFPFASNGIDIPIGINENAVESVIDLGDQLFFLGSDYNVYTLRDNQISNVTPNIINKRIKDAGITSAYGMKYEVHGHKFYLLKLPTETLAYDLSTGFWSSWVIDIVTSTFVYDKWLVSTSDGKIGELDVDTYADFGTTFTTELVPYIVFGEDKLITIKRVELEMSKGNTPINQTEGSISMDLSFDGGITYDGALTRTTGVGAIAEKPNVSWDRVCKTKRPQRRVDFKFGMSSGMEIELYGMTVSFRPPRRGRLR